VSASGLDVYELPRQLLTTRYLSLRDLDHSEARGSLLNIGVLYLIY